MPALYHHPWQHFEQHHNLHNHRIYPRSKTIHTMECSRQSTSVSIFSSRFSYQVFEMNNMLTSCLEHIVNLANIAVMGHITKIAAVENATAIWEYDLDLPNNRLLGGSLDVIAAVCTIAIKVSFLSHYLFSHWNLPSKIQASGQHIEYFEKLQLNCKVDVPLRIPLHSNVRWGSAYNMLDRSFKLCQVSQIICFYWH